MKISKSDLSITNCVSPCKKGAFCVQHVRIEKDRIVGTDGYILCIREVEGDTEFEPFLIDPKTFKTLAGTGAILNVKDGKLKIKSATQQRDAKGRYTNKVVEDGRFVSEVKTIDEKTAKYPDYRKISDSEDPENARTLLNPRILIRILKAFEGVSFVKMSINRSGMVKFEGMTSDNKKVTGWISPVEDRRCK